jgi:hypothetical protein
MQQQLLRHAEGREHLLVEQSIRAQLNEQDQLSDYETKRRKVQGSFESDEESSKTTENEEVSDEKRLGKQKAVRKAVRKYDKVLACFYCHKLLKMKMKRHLETVHRDEPEVQRLLLLADKSEKKTGFARLVNRGNFIHNTDVLRGSEGELIVRRRPQVQRTTK